MDNFLYRFRSADVLLHKYSELENQEIYFASPEELNDPTEGLKDIFWKGDEIVWKNLLKNYLRCLEIFSQYFLLIGESEAIENLEIPVFLCEDDLKTKQHKDIQNSIIELFFKSPDVINFVKKIASSENPIRRDGLYLYLLEIHFRALAVIRSQYQICGLMNRSHDDKIINEFSATPVGDSELFLLTEEAIKEYPGEGNIDDVLHASIVKIHREMDLLDSVNAHGRENNRNGYFLTRRFPEAYIRAIEKLIYPDWFAACFMGQSSSKNLSAWAHYADNHKGFCLKFKVDRTDENEIFSLYGINGFSGGKGKTQYNKGEVPIQVRAINYQRNRPELDFFRFIGRLPVPALNKNW